LERYVGVLKVVKKAVGWCTAQCKMLLFHARTIVRDLDNIEEERKTFGPFWEFLVWYFCDAFLRHWESFWS